jgi:4-carboxymuconolactone decarboxylase
MSRLAPKPDQMTPAQREQYERMTAIRPPDEHGRFGGPIDPWILSPDFARRALDLNSFLLEHASLDRRIVEVAILTTARHWKSNFQWMAHVRIARREGVAEEFIESVLAGERPTAGSEDDLIAFDACRSLLDRHELPQGLYDRAVDRFGEHGLVDLIGTVGFFTMAAMTMKAFDVGISPDLDPPFPE